VRAGLLRSGERLLAYPWSSFGAYLAASKHRPAWVRVDRLLAEHGIGRDTAEGRREFERRMEARRLDAAVTESLKALRRGWCLGSADFRREKLEQMENELGKDHAGALRRESAEAKAERLVGQELKRLRWTEADLAARRKSDPLKLAIAARLRRETTLSLKAIAARVHLGTSKGANTNLHKWMQAGAANNPQPSDSQS